MQNAPAQRLGHSAQRSLSASGNNMNSRPHKQSMSELKLRRLTEHNQRLRDDLARPRVRVSEASQSLIRYCKTTKDHLVPSVWGPVGKGEDPYAPPAQGCNCVVM
ncbi:Guanine nucleotide-binding protein subunit gamma 1 [Tulasnella sp. 419]|nr:Guanine nucleotide-binding protein subunit gamma 1 [Tulasnella sp. 419]